jgi:hypothetical protein
VVDGRFWTFARYRIQDTGCRWLTLTEAFAREHVTLD